MICEACGQNNVPGTQFCTSCQAFLEWEAPQNGSPAPPATPAPRPQPSPQPHHSPQPRPAPQPSPQPPPPVVAAAAPRRPGDDPDEPVPGPEALPDVPPGPPSTPPGPPPAPPVRCPNCRTENAPDRTLCIRCALLLDPGPPPDVRPPWWRRILRRRPRQAPTAGTRPRRRLWRRPGLALPIVLIVLACGVWFALPHVSGWFGFAKDETGTPEAVPPTRFRASSRAAGHPAGAAFDGFNNRYWAPSAAGPDTGVGQYLECDFEQPVRVLKLVVFSGTSAKMDEFLTQARPARITVLLTSADGTSVSKKLRVKDQPGQQTFDLRGSEIVRARLTTDTTYGAGPGRRLAVAEIEFFGRRS
ncbi:discoidin domain-containing protein [Streptomyces sp. NPDC059832]|uniref:discoidin domain-containing protein n=1 Tax=unclassified Streptomyces TaxID=2593676 RepID=UPI00365F9470